MKVENWQWAMLVIWIMLMIGFMVIRGINDVDGLETCKKLRIRPLGKSFFTGAEYWN